MADYRAFKKSEQRELAQQIAADLNDGITRERHAEIAATVLTSDWLAAHDAAVEAAVRADQIEKDAAIADAFDWQSWSEPNRVIAAAIRAQLTEGEADE